MHTVCSARAHGWRRGLLLAVALAAVLLFVATAHAQAAPRTTGTFVGRDDPNGQFVRFTTPRNKRVNDWAGVLLLQLDKNTQGDRLGPLARMFCIQLFVVVRPNDLYYANGSVTALHGGCYIRYLLAHYPATTVGTPAEGAARQLAIWHFSDDLDLSTVEDVGIRTRAQALAAEAQLQVDTNGCPGTNTGVATLTLAPSSARVPEGQPVIFTARIDPPEAAVSLNVSVDGSAVLNNGQQAATLAFNQGVAYFSVLNLNVGTVNVTAQVPYVMDQGTVFDPLGGRQTQRLVLGETLNLTTIAQVQTFFEQTTATPTATPTNTPVTKTPGFGGDTTPTNTPTGTPTSTPSTRKRTPPTETPTSTPTLVFDTPTPPAPATSVPTPTLARIPTRLPNTGAPADRVAVWLALAFALLLAGAATRRGLRP